MGGNRGEYSLIALVHYTLILLLHCMFLPVVFYGDALVTIFVFSNICKIFVYRRSLSSKKSLLNLEIWLIQCRRLVKSSERNTLDGKPEI